MDEFGVALSDPEAFARSPSAVASLGAAAAAPTASVPVIADVPSGPTSKSNSDAQTVVAAKKKADTTLSGAASESAVREPAPAAPARAGAGRRVAVIGGAAAAVAAVAVVALLKIGGGSAATATTPTGTTAPTGTSAPATTPATVAPIAAVTAPRPPKAIEQIEVALKSDPIGAKVVRTDGVVVGVTPVTMKLDKGSAPFEVQLELDGYRAEKRTITADVNREVDVNLLKAPSSGKRAAKAVTSKPAEAKPAEAKPAQAKPADKPADPDKDLIPAQL